MTDPETEILRWAASRVRDQYGEAGDHVADRIERAMAASAVPVCIVCDWKGDTARFIEAEIDGASVSLPWHDRPDGLKELRIERIAPPAVPVESLGRDAGIDSPNFKAVAWFDTFNAHVYYDHDEAQRAHDGGNTVLPIESIGAPPPASVPDWRQAFIENRKARYIEFGMKVEQARINAETDAEMVEIYANTPPTTPEPRT